MCGKLKIGSDLVLKNESSKNLSTIHIKSDKNNFTCIQCEEKEWFTTRPKQSLAYRF